MKRRILVVLPYTPWPPRLSGIAVRYAPVLRHLCRTHEVDLLVIENASQPVDFGELAPLLRVAERMAVPPPDSRLRVWATRLASMLPWSVAHSLVNYSSAQITAAVAARFIEGRHDCVLWAGREFLQSAMQFRRRFPAVRFVLDLVDSPYLYASRELAAQGAPSRFARYDLWKVGRMERWVRRHMNAVIYISPIDAAAAGAGPARVTVLPNGVLTDTLDPDGGDRAPRRCIGFLGNMTYPPNVRAALALHRDVYLPLCDFLPGLELLIIGRDPAPEILALSGPGVTITGTVPDVWPWIRQVDVFAFPFDTGAGLQNKVLEAMFAAKPVVTTPACLAPLGAEVPRDLLCGSTAAELAAQVRCLLEHPQAAAALGARGRDFARRNFDWEKLLPRFEDAITGESAP